MTSPAQSIFKTQAQDRTVATRLATFMDIFKPEVSTAKLASRGLIVDHSSFDDGTLQGWRQHMTADQPALAPFLVAHPTKSGRWAMGLSTDATRDYNAANYGNTAGAFKNLSQYRPKGYASISAWQAWSGDGSHSTAVAGTTGNHDIGFSSFGVGLDSQAWGKWTDTTLLRGFFKLYFKDVVSSDDPAWCVVDDSGNDVIISNSRGVTAGPNEWKWNFNYIRLTVNFGSGTMSDASYVEAQINHQVFDLTGIGAGRGLQAPQTGSPIAAYSGGMNGSVLLARSSRYPTTRHNRLVTDDIVVTVNDQVAS